MNGPDGFLPTVPGTQLSFEVTGQGRGPRSLLRHLLRHWLRGRRGFACPWCPRPTLKYLDDLGLSGLCGATDGAGQPEGPYGRCILPAGHPGDWHQELRYGELWAEWRGPHPGQQCGICGKDGSEH